ncbi:hypothetical protein Cgig2_026210 [Carnegiea gigantea]|uniref:DM2 domain-containing protein n=1 Tax=Carnegiea gigantea TaxID=171969 RepID=A0A9Q1JMQ6_9CARY|nr:hypothetical protein Cgig2_026210 [Carnegiea gigantea]
MLPQRLKKTMVDNPKKLAKLIDLVNLPSTLREFVGQSQTSRLGCFMRVWFYIKENNLQDPQNKNLVNCDEKLKSILLGKSKVDLAELPALIKLHLPKESNFFVVGRESETVGRIMHKGNVVDEHLLGSEAQMGITGLAHEKARYISTDQVLQLQILSSNAGNGRDLLPCDVKEFAAELSS